MATLNVVTKTNWTDAIPAYWDKGIMPEADRESLLSRLAGKEGTDAAIVEKNDLTKQPGDTIHFTTLQRLIGSGVSGTTALEGAEEKLINGRFTVTVELRRHATAADEIARVESIIDFPQWAAKQMGGWLARFLDDQAIDGFLNQDAITTIYAGGKTTLGALGPGDVLLAHELRKLHMAGQRRGLKPFRTMRGTNMPFPVYAAIMSEVDYYNLVSSDGFRQDVRLAAERGEKNPALSGDVDMYNGVLIFRWSSVNPGDGFLGSYLRPEARLGTTVNSSATTVIAGPTTPLSNVDYWKYFPQTGTNTLLIDSEQVTYASAPGDSSLTSATRAAGGTSAAAHTAGALITLNNVGKTLLLGSNAMMRAWAMRPTKVTQSRDYDMELGIGIKFINGVEMVQNGDDIAANAMVLASYSANPTTV